MTQEKKKQDDAPQLPLAELMKIRRDKVTELADKNILVLPLSGGGLDLKTTDVNRLLEMYGLQRAAEANPGNPPPEDPQQ